MMELMSTMILNPSLWTFIVFLDKSFRTGFSTSVLNASIINGVGACRLQRYRFEEAISIPFFTYTWRLESLYDEIKANRAIGFHTLCLLGMSL